MSFVSDLLSSNKGAGFQAQGVELLKPATEAQATNLYGQSQDALRQQQEFVNALQAQGGAGNQSSVFNQQQQLANQLNLQAQGQGPNPAQAALAQNTSQNIANQASLMAGQRGTGANAGLIARQAAQQGGNLQQQSVGQAATMQAQQQLAAQQALQQQQAAMAGLATQQVGQQAGALQGLNAYTQGEQQNVLGMIANQNNSMVSNNAGVNQANAHMAGINAQGQWGLLGGAAKGASGAAAGGGGAARGGMVHDGTVDHYADGGDVNNDKKEFENSLREFMGTPITQGITPEEQRERDYATIREKNKQAFGYAQGGEVEPQSFYAKMLKSTSQDTQPNPFGSDSGSYGGGQKAGQAMGQGFGSMGKSLFKSSPVGDEVGSMGSSDLMDPNRMAAFKGGKVPAKVSPGEVYLNPKKVEAVKKGKASPLDGEKIKGKAKVKGDSLANDVVSKDLDEGGIVLPRSVTQHPDAPKKAHDFVAALIAKQGLRRK